MRAEKKETKEVGYLVPRLVEYLAELLVANLVDMLVYWWVSHLVDLTVEQMVQWMGL